MRGICKAAARVGDTIGEACEACGHTNLVHPGTHNPALSACVLCETTRVEDRETV